MKRVFSLALIGLMLSGLVYLMLQTDPGYVRISWGTWILESNLLVIAALNVILLVAIGCIWALVRQTFGLQARYLHWRRNSKSQKALHKTQAGLLAFLEGDWSDAAQLLKKGAGQSSTPLVNYLAAAHAESELGHRKEAESLLQKAYDETHDSEFAVGIAKAQMALEQDDLESCLATLVRLKSLKPHHPFVLKLLRTVYLRLEDWQQLLQLLPELKKLPKADQQKLAALEEQAWTGLFTQKADEMKRAHQDQKASEVLADLWKQLPESIRFDEQILFNYAEQLIRLNKQDEAEVLLRKMLTRNWSDQLVGLYGQVASSQPAEQLISAENWLKSRPNNAQLLLALGRLSMLNELWGKAKEYFEASNTLQVNHECLAELCRLEQRLGKTNLSENEHFERLLETLSLPKLPMPQQKN